MSESVVPVEFQKPEGLRTLGNYLRGAHGVKNKSATQHDKRVEYFRGSKLLEVLVEEDEDDPLLKWPKTLPKIKDRAVGVAVAELFIQNDFFHRSEKVPEKKKYLQVSKINIFEESGYYTWMYEGSKTWAYVGTIALVAVVIGFTLLPVWPIIAKKILWYISVTFLICTLSFCFVRFLLFMLVWIFGYEFWIFPNLFDETMAFTDSFKPLFMFEGSIEGQGYYRMGLVGGLVAFIAWVMTQPTEFDTFLAGQKTFLDDLYSGNLLSDVAGDHKENLDKVRQIPKFEDLLNEDFFGKPSTPDSEDAMKTKQENETATEAEAEGEAPPDMEALMEEEADMQAMLDELTRLEEEEEAEEAAAEAAAQT